MDGFETVAGTQYYSFNQTHRKDLFGQVHFYPSFLSLVNLKFWYLKLTNFHFIISHFDIWAIYDFYIGFRKYLLIFF